MSKDYVGDPWWTLGNTATQTGPYYASQAKIKTFLCPSDSPYDSTQVMACFHVSLGEFYWVDFTGPADFVAALGRSNYAGMSGLSGNDPDPTSRKYIGMFTNRTIVSLSSLPDGTANTIMFGESLGTNVVSPRTQALSSMARASCRLTGAWMKSADRISARARQYNVQQLAPDRRAVCLRRRFGQVNPQAQCPILEHRRYYRLHQLHPCLGIHRRNEHRFFLPWPVTAPNREVPMRSVILIPLTLAAGMALLSAGCTKTKDATKLADQKPTPADMKANDNGVGKVGHAPRRID